MRNVATVDLQMKTKDALSKNPKAVQYYVYVLSIIPRTARASEGLNIYIRSRL